jgi:type IV secretion system protein TrbL
MNDLNVIDRFTDVFSRYIDSGFGLLAGDVAFLTGILVALDIVLAGLFWALMGEENVPAQLIHKVLYVGFFAFVLNNFSSLANIIFRSFAGLGLKASAASLTAQDLMRPGFVAEAGFTASRPLLDKAGELIGFASFFNNFVTITVLMLAWLIVLLAFFVLAVQLFITIIEFKLTTLAGFVLVPFALFGKTAFLAERVLGNVITSGIKLMVLAIVVGIKPTSSAASSRRRRTPSPQSCRRDHLAALAVFGLAIFVPGIAAGLVTGAPQQRCAAVATTAGAVGAGVAAGALTVGGLRLGSRLAGGSVRAAASLAGTGGAAHEQAGMRGVAQAAIIRPAANLAATATAPVRDAYRQGAAQGYRATTGEPERGNTRASAAGADPPAWAQRLSRRQHLRDAAVVASQAVREGDRPMGSASPDLKDGGKG